MKIFIQKFAKGGGQIGGIYAEYAVPYTPLETEPMVFSGSDSKSTTKSSKKDDENTQIRDLAKLYEGVKANTNDADYTLGQFIQEIDRALLLSIDGKLSPEAYLTAYVRGLANYNRLSRSYDKAEDARKQLEQKNSLDEVAIDRNGQLLVLGEDGLDSISVQEYTTSPSSYKVLTNRNLLDLRTLNPSFVFREDIYDNMTGVGMDQIVDKINKLVQHIGTTKKEQTIDETRTIQQGMEFIQQANEEGIDLSQGSEMIIRNGLATEEQLQQAQAAINTVIESLNPQEQALVAYHSVSNGGKGLVSYLTNLIGSRTSSMAKQTSLISRIFSPTGTKSTSKKEGTDKGDTDKSNQLMQMQQMQGGVHRTIQWITKDGTQSMGTIGVHYPHIENVKADMSLDAMLNESGMAGIVQGFGGITFGDQRIPFNNLKDIMYENQGGYVSILPATTDEQGNRVVDLSIMDTYKKIVNELTEPKGSEAWKQALANKLKQEGLSQYLMGDGQLDDKRFGLFFIATGYTTDRWNFNKDSKWIEKYNQADKAFERHMSQALSTDEKKQNYNVDIDDWGIGWIAEGSWDDIYRGTIYIPLNFNINAAINAHGDQVSIESARRYERDYQVRDKVQGANTQIGSDVLQQQ